MSNNKNKLNINNEFKGKSADIQQKATIRPNQTGMQTLGKAVSARRMPKPANLPSLRSEHANIITTASSSSSSTVATAASNHSSNISNNLNSNNNNSNNISNEQTWATNDDLSDEMKQQRQTWSTNNNYKNNNTHDALNVSFLLKKQNRY